MYGVEQCFPNRQKTEVQVEEMKMLRYSLGVTRMDRIKNEQIRGTVKVKQFEDKVRGEVMIGHVLRKELDISGKGKGENRKTSGDF